MAIGALATLAAVACAELNSDISRVHPPYEKKSIFDGSWYFKKTVIDAAPGNQWVSEGDGDWAVIERLRWRITERYLYGYRDWEFVAGSEQREYEGSDYYGAPVVMYGIKEHFDIRRSYNPQTGEETNTIDKNYERPWKDREYMVVDWAQNMAPIYGLVSWNMYWDDYTPFVPLSNITSSTYYVQAHEIDNPDRARIGDGYIDFVGKYTLWPDLLGCYYYQYGAPDCAPGEIHVRHSFWRANPDNDYDTMPYPDAVDLVDANGNYVRDQNGVVKRIPIFERFGDYRLDRLTYDNDYAVTESGVMRRVSRFNLWEKSKDANGAPIPYHLRTPKPIIYYLNVEFPDDADFAGTNYEQYTAKEAAYLVGRRWNEPFRNVVAMLRAMSRANTSSVSKADVAAELADVPDMFVVKDNSCNIANVKAFVADHSELDDTLTQYMGGVALLNKTNLPSACTIIESETAGTDHPFTWQRHGDLRYNMLVWVAKWQEAGWGGLGPMFMDPLTGEIVSSTAHYAGAVMETSISRVLDYVDALNGQIDDFDIITGQDIIRYIKDVHKKMQNEAAQPVSQALINEMDRRFRALGAGGRQGLLTEISPEFSKARLERIKGTPLESLVVGEDDYRLAHAVLDPYAAATDGMPELMDLASPVRDFRRELPFRERKRDLEVAKRVRDMPKFFDPALISTALKLKDLPREERRARLRHLIFDAVMTHEVGHNIGMRHNFSASTDALNFGPEFWYLRDLPEDLDDARDQLVGLGDDARAAEIDRCLDDQAANPEHVVTAQECLGAWENMYSSIMDYHGKAFGDFGGLNEYDMGFVYFVYGNMLEVFDDGAIDEAQLPDYNGDTIKDSKDLNRWLFLNDYKRIPEVFYDGAPGIQARHYERYNWGALQTTQEEPRWTVPMKFCGDEYAGMLPDCRMSDYGVTQTEMITSDLMRYHEYYYFTHFLRGRTNWYWFYGPMNGNANLMFNMLNTFQYMYYYRAHDPNFFASDAGQDYLKASVLGVNLFAEVIGTPANGYFEELDNTGGMLVDSQRTGFWKVYNAKEWAAPSTQGLPTTGGLGVMGEFGYFNDCDVPGDAFAMVPLGAGRPFLFGLSADYEDYYFTYLGSYFDKDNALFLLGYPQSTFLDYAGVGGPGVDPRTFSVNFFRLFRPEVLRTFYGVISNDLTTYAPVVRKDSRGEWVFEPRKLIDLDGELPDYTPGPNVKLLPPSMSYNLPYFALMYGAALMTSMLDAEQDFNQLIKIAVKGQQDDIADFDRVAADQKVEFVHPISGITFRALKQGEMPIGYMMVQEANRRLQVWREWQACVDDPNKIDGRCQCIYQSQVVDAETGQYVCPPRETIPCTPADRAVSAEQAMESVERQVELINNVRLFHDYYEYSL